MKDRINKKLEEIINITQNYNNILTIDDIGLFTGKTGLVLFNFYYYKLTKEIRYADSTTKIITEIIQAINGGENAHTFCNGLAGFGWTMEHLFKNNFTELTNIDFLKNLDHYLYKKMLNDFNSDNYDLLHGAIGAGMYFLNHLSDPKSYEIIVQLIDGLENICIKEIDGSIKWESVIIDIDEKTQHVYDLCLSHGIASIIAFLAKVYAKDIYKEKVIILLNGAVQFLLKHKSVLNNDNSYFPNWVNLDGTSIKSRLAWCYGDLGIGIALFNAAKVTSNIKLEEISLEILLQTTQRKNLETEGIVDAGICHGTSGIALIYLRMYGYTNNNVFKEASEYWLNLTLDLAKFEDGYAGYKTYRMEKYGGWSNDISIIEGIVGIGLVLMSFVSDIETKWDECFLLR